MSLGHFNNIYIIFQADAALDPEVVNGAAESTFTVKDTKVMWRSYTTVVEGRSVVRKEAVMPDILPHENAGSSSDYIWIRMDADSQQILDQLTTAAEAILRDCGRKKPKEDESLASDRRGLRRSHVVAHVLGSGRVWGESS